VVSDSGAAQGSSGDPAWCLSSGSASHVCIHMVVVFGAGIFIGELAGGLVRDGCLCHPLLCAHAAGRTNALRTFWERVSRLHAAYRAAHSTSASPSRSKAKAACGSRSLSEASRRTPLPIGYLLTNHIPDLCG